MGGERAEDFPYSQLDSNTSTVRLLRLQKTQNGHIIGWLEPFSLEDPECPSYNTLSYIWGEKKYSHVIEINGHRFPILERLYPVLGVICDDEGLRNEWWWVDSICIDQKPDAEAERNVQVQMMKRIYEKSSKTVGWLGQGTEDGEEGIEFLHLILKHYKRLKKEMRLEGKQLGVELIDRQKWAALDRLLLRPWWARVWTLQEYIVASQFQFYCGKQSIDRDELKMAAYAVYLCRRIDKTILSEKAFDGVWIRRRLLMWYREGSPMKLLALMACVGNYESTDPRDKIYSLMGLAQDRSLADPPRYQDGVCKVYSELVRSFVSRYGSLDVICFVDRFNKHSVKAPTQPPLPSWVPDWRATIIPWIVPVMASQSAGKHIGNFRPSSEKDAESHHYCAGPCQGSLQAEFSADLRVLTCQGILVDYVDGIGGMKVVQKDNVMGNRMEYEVYECINSKSPANVAYPEATREEHPKSGTSDSAFRTLETMKRCLLLGRKDRYQSYPTPPGYLAEEFLALCLSSLRTPLDSEPQFRDWFELNRSFQVQGYSLEELCLAIEKVGMPMDSSYDKDISHHHPFLSRFKDTTDGMARRMVTTDDGLIGMGPCRVQPGDQIWVLLGCSIPLVLRSCEKTQTYEVIGECYLDGYMNGEVLKDLTAGKFRIEKVQLS